MKSLKINKEDAFVCSKWRRLIRGGEGIVMIAGVSVCNHFLVPSFPGKSSVKPLLSLYVVHFVCDL